MVDQFVAHPSLALDVPPEPSVNGPRRVGIVINECGTRVQFDGRTVWQAGHDVPAQSSVVANISTRARDGHDVTRADLGCPADVLRADGVAPGPAPRIFIDVIPTGRPASRTRDCELCVGRVHAGRHLPAGKAWLLLGRLAAPR